MRILMVVEHFYPYVGGAEELFCNLAASLVAEGHKVQVITTRFDSSLPTTDEYEGIQIHRVVAPNRYLFTIMAIPAVWRMASGFHLIHTTSYNAALPAYFVARWRKKPVIITFHELWGSLWKRLPGLQGWQRLAFARYERWVSRFGYNKMVAVSDFTAKRLQEEGISVNRIVRIYNGLDYHSLSTIRQTTFDARTLLFIGRLGASKGLDLLLPAFATFVSHHPEAHLRLVVPKAPAGAYYNLLERIQELELSGYITLLHALRKSEVLQLMANSGMVVIPSYSEGFGFVAAEATALGVPIISSHQGALPEVVGGKVVRMKAQTEPDLVQAMEAAWDGLWEQLPVRQFPLADTVAAYKQLYQELIQ